MERPFKFRIKACNSSGVKPNHVSVWSRRPRTAVRSSRAPQMRLKEQTAAGMLALETVKRIQELRLSNPSSYRRHSPTGKSRIAEHVNKSFRMEAEAGIAYWRR